MTGNSNLDGDGQAAIGSAIDGMTTLDMQALRDRVSEEVFGIADSSVTYTSDALDIISRYESHPAAMDCDDRLGGGTYTADKWINAMTAYAGAIAVSVIEADAYALLDEMEGKRTAIYLAALRHGFDGSEVESAPRVSASCPHGWARHDSEDDDGVHYWSQPELEGCRAVAVKVAGVWLSYTWTPGEGTSARE